LSFSNSLRFFSTKTTVLPISTPIAVVPLPAVKSKTTSHCFKASRLFLYLFKEYLTTSNHLSSKSLA
jgi:hypothetical protein